MILYPCSCCSALIVWLTLLQCPSIANKHATYLIVVSNRLLLLHSKHLASTSTFVWHFCCHVTCNCAAISCVAKGFEVQFKLLKFHATLSISVNYNPLKLRFPFLCTYFLKLFDFSICLPVFMYVSKIFRVRTCNVLQILTTIAII